MPDLSNPFKPTQTEKERQADLEKLKSLIARAKQDPIEIRSTDPISGGQKGVKLQRFSLIPVEFLWALAEHYGLGARKYDERNWEKGYAWSKSIDALERHLALWKMGEWNDPETGSSHMIAVAWHAIALFIYKLRGLGTDDITPKKPDYNQYSIAGAGPATKTTGYIAPPGIPIPYGVNYKDFDHPFQDQPISNRNPQSR